MIAHVVAPAMLLCLAGLFAVTPAAARGLPRVKVSDNGRFLMTQQGKPFFWLGDTAWLLMVRPNLAEAERYLQVRAAQGFTVIQVMAVPWGATTTRNAAGELAFVEGDPARPNEKYFQHVDAVVDRAARLGLYLGLVATWGDAWNPPGDAKPLLTPESAEAYGEFLGRRYRDQRMIWILGGDRNPETDRHLAIVRALARGLRRGDGGRHLMSFHPSGWASSSKWFHTDDWLSFNMVQSGHSQHNTPNYDLIAADYARTPPKPCADGEADYEDHPVNWKPESGYFDDYDVRKTAYWAVFAGAHGHTYGCNDVWQFWQPGIPPETGARTPWGKALLLPGARQMHHLRALMESRPFLTRIPDQTLIVGGAGEGARHVQATRDATGSYAFIYVPTAKQTVQVDTSTLSGKRLKAWWYDPRTGKTTEIKGGFPVGGRLEFTTPATGPDWVLVLDDVARRFGPPGGTHQP